MLFYLTKYQEYVPVCLRNTSHSVIGCLSSEPWLRILKYLQIDKNMHRTINILETSNNNMTCNNLLLFKESIKYPKCKSLYILICNYIHLLHKTIKGSGKGLAGATYLNEHLSQFCVYIVTCL